MNKLQAHLAGRLRSSSLSAVPPRPESQDYSPELARHAASILFQSPIPSRENRPIYILNAAALPDSREENFDSLLPYVLARLPEEDDLVRGFEYEVIFFAGDSDGSATAKRNRPGWGWFLQAYHVLSRAMRKRLQKLYIVHEKAWVRILTEVFSTIVSPKFRRKIIHAADLTNLALHIPIEDLLIPPSTYLYDRRVSDDIYAPYASGRRAFGARQPLPISVKGAPRLPRVLRETTAFVLMEKNVVSEGLFRVPPHSKLRDVLKEAYDRGQKFIVYKDNEATLPLPPYPNGEHQDEIIAELDAKDAYSVFMAAALIKAWYAELRQPIFPSASYRELKRLYGNHDDLPDIERLTELFSPTSQWSFLPLVSREIVVKHLLPTLSAVAAHEEHNKMTPENLAVCIAPALLHGPDQFEDAKMSSIVRRIFTEAIELWPQGLREACGETLSAFEAAIELPANTMDWEDPLEQADSEVGNAQDETHVTGIVLKDNEKSEMPPALPPRSNTISGRASNDAATKRKPAPPLQVPPRYSTIITDSPTDTTSAMTLAATTDGFAPRKENSSARGQVPDEKKSGTSSGDSYAPQIVLPKRKTLTAEQIDHAENDITHAQGQQPLQQKEWEAALAQKSPSDFRGMPLPGLAKLSIGKPEAGAKPTAPASPSIKRKAVSGTYNAELKSPTSATSVTSPTSTTSSNNSPTIAVSTPFPEFRRPSLPASANRSPSINSLARPVFPTNPITNRPQSKSTSLPVPGPKPRTPSPSLLQRMPSMEATNKSSLAPPSQPRRLNMKKQSVDDLRRLYEERAGTAHALVEAGRKR